MDLNSILIITYLASGTPIESWTPMAHGQCMAAQSAISKTIKGPRKHRKTVELLSGKKAPILSVECLPGCIPGHLGLEALDLMIDGEDA